MLEIKNDTLTLTIDENIGLPQGLWINGDPQRMNWLIDPDYLREIGYPDEDKRLGAFTLSAGGQDYESAEMSASLRADGSAIATVFAADRFEVRHHFSANDSDSLRWKITLRNTGRQNLKIDRFHVWLPISYIMFRDRNVIRNMEQSCAVFPSVSDGFSKIAAVRRSNKAPHLGLFNTKGRTLSVGSLCRYQNLFARQVSPSLDGVILHALSLADERLEQESPNAINWIYPAIGGTSIRLGAGEACEWEYVFAPFNDVADFERQALRNGHPILRYTPVLPAGGRFQAVVELPEGRAPAKTWLERSDGDGICVVNATSQTIKNETGLYSVELPLSEPGEYKWVVELDDAATDFAVFSVLPDIAEMIEARVDYLCERSYNDRVDDPNRYAFEPVSNQGESIGKLNLILMKNLLARKNTDQIRKVENSAVFYVKNRWFDNGIFSRPIKLYGLFYRIFDLDYIAHLYYLLSCFDREDLQHHDPAVYLGWAAELLEIRFDPDRHADDREKKETGLTGVFTLYIDDLLRSLREYGMEEQHRRLMRLWQAFADRLERRSEAYEGAITEHYYDNAGFGPSCEALCLSGRYETTLKYGELIKANIGFSNDYRAQNPDRWWEALAYMIHSLWGGLVAHSALVAYEHLNDVDYLKAAYRATMAVFYCYDWNVSSCSKTLKKGEAASTYCVSNPNMNKPSLSHNRFGQSVFIEDEEILVGNATGDDWDMGEELVAYLIGFGTKTYIYTDGDGITCRNGYVEKLGDFYVITSYAAYPRAFLFQEMGLIYRVEGNEPVRRVATNGKSIWVYDTVTQ